MEMRAWFFYFRVLRWYNGFLTGIFIIAHISDILHPNRANISKDELRGKLSELYKSKKDQVSVFGLRTHYGGGKTTGFALIYDSTEALKKFEPRYRLVRIGAAEKIEKASRQQRMFLAYPNPPYLDNISWDFTDKWIYLIYRQTKEKPVKEVPGHRKDQGTKEGQEG